MIHYTKNKFLSFKDGLDDDDDYEMDCTSSESENDEHPTFVTNRSNLDDIKHQVSLKIVDHKKKYKISQKASTEISEEWRLYYHDLFKKGIFFLIDLF